VDGEGVMRIFEDNEGPVYISDDIREFVRLHRKIHNLWTTVCILGFLLFAAVCAWWDLWKATGH